MQHRITETLFILGAGEFATRGAVEELDAGPVPLVLAAGVYDGSGAEQHLLSGPDWTGLDIDPPPAEDVRTLDLRTGVLHREEPSAAHAPLRSVRFASIALPGVVALRAESAAGRLRPNTAFRTPPDSPLIRGHEGGRAIACSPAHGAGIAAVAEQRTRRTGTLGTVERVAGYVASGHRRPNVARAARLLDAAAGRGFDRLLTEQRAAWARRWDTVDVRIPDDPPTQLAVRFALFQLWCNVSRHDELAVGARGLSGTGYAGHVFWDADAFVLPAILSIDPPRPGRYCATGCVGCSWRRRGRAPTGTRERDSRGSRPPPAPT